MKLRAGDNENCMNSQLYQNKLVNSCRFYSFTIGTKKAPNTGPEMVAQANKTALLRQFINDANGGIVKWIYISSPPHNRHRKKKKIMPMQRRPVVWSVQTAMHWSLEPSHFFCEPKAGCTQWWWQFGWRNALQCCNLKENNDNWQVLHFKRFDKTLQSFGFKSFHHQVPDIISPPLDSNHPLPSTTTLSSHLDLIHQSPPFSLLTIFCLVSTSYLFWCHGSAPFSGANSAVVGVSVFAAI